VCYKSLRDGDRAKAERAARRCLTTCRDTAVGAERYATYLFMLAAVLAECGKFDEAIAYGEEAVALFGRLYGESDSFVEFRKRDLQHMRDGVLRRYIER
jgi:hypothetical protein